MNRRALLVALVLASMGASLLYFYLRRFEQEASGGDKVKLLATSKPIERGTVITEDLLVVREIPQAYVEDRAVKASDKAKVVGLRVGGALGAQTTLMWTDLAVATDERRDLSNLVQPGNRAVSVRASGDDKSFALIHPGDYVDIVATMPTAGKARRTDGDRPLATSVGPRRRPRYRSANDGRRCQAELTRPRADGEC